MEQSERSNDVEHRTRIIAGRSWYAVSLFLFINDIGIEG